MNPCMQEGSVCAILGQNFCLLRSTWIFACNFQFDKKPLPFIFFTGLHFFFWEKTIQKKTWFFLAASFSILFSKPKTKETFCFSKQWDQPDYCLEFTCFWVIRNQLKSGSVSWTWEIGSHVWNVSDPHAAVLLTTTTVRRESNSRYKVPFIPKLLV